jgi:hypothetical protein
MSGQATDAGGLADDLLELIADARLVQQHLAEAGKLPGTSLGLAIDALERAQGTADVSARVADLSFEYSKAIELAKPVTVRQMRRLAARRYVSWAREVTTAMVAVGLIFFAVLGFVIVQDINESMAELQRINVQNPLQKLTELRRLISEGALNDPKSAYYLQYLKAQNELALMFDSANQILERTAASTQRRQLDRIDGEHGDTGVAAQIYNLVAFELFGPTGIALPHFRSAPPAAGAGGASAPLPLGGVVGMQVGGVAADAGGMPGAVGGVTGLGGANPDSIYKKVPAMIGPENCKPYDSTPVKKLYGSANQQFLAAALDKFDDYCLAQTLDIRVGAYRPASAIHTVRVLKDQLFMIGVLFLPLIGGLLGATISIIYGMINNTRAARLPLPYILVRIVSGGAFGVMIGWFSSTAGSGPSDVVQHVSGTPFTLAILAGFSIESLSTVLLTFSRSVSAESTKK